MIKVVIMQMADFMGAQETVRKLCKLDTSFLRALPDVKKYDADTSGLLPAHEQVRNINRHFPLGLVQGLFWLLLCVCFDAAGTPGILWVQGYRP